MIKVTYNTEGIRVEISEISQVIKNLPLNLQIKKHVSKETQWSSELNDFWFATYPNTEMFDVVVSDSKGLNLYKKEWDIMEHGNDFYKKLWLYNKSLISQGKLPVGLVIGTHDGEFGEWVPIVLKRECKVFLVEASKPQYDKLVKNYQNNSLVTTIKELITPDGGEVEFFEGGEGYTNTVVEKVIKFWETSHIESSKKQSISINNLIEKYCGCKPDWLHLDVEGLDAKLIKAIRKEFLPNFIIYEDFNLPHEERIELETYLVNQNFKVDSEKGISLAIR